MFVFTQAPEGSTIEYMDRYQAQAERMLRGLPEVERVFSVIALGIGTPGSGEPGRADREPLPTRDERERSQQQVVNELRPMLEAIPGITAFPTSPSPLSGFGAAPVAVRDRGRRAAAAGAPGATRSRTASRPTAASATCRPTCT